MRVKLLALVALLLGFGFAARAATPTGPTFRVIERQDSVRVIASWKHACDLRGCADSTRVAWSVGAIVHPLRHTRGTSDTITIPQPAWGDSVLVTVTVTPLRRQQFGASRQTTLKLTTPDAPPPPVDSLVIDTLTAHADSGRLELYDDAGHLLGGTGDGQGAPAMAEGDSAMAVWRVWLKPGVVRQPGDTVRWEIHDTGDRPAIMRIGRILGRWRDTMWLHAVSCNCRESGDPENPPHLDLRSGAYVVRDGTGGWRPVTPRPADPYATAAP